MKLYKVSMRAKSFGLILFSLSSSMLWGATNTWNGNSSNLWSNAGNWSAGTPVNGQDLSFPNGGNNPSNTNDINNLNIPSITIDGNTVYTLSGNTITLTAPTPTISFNPTALTFGGKTINNGLIIGANLSVTSGTTSGTNTIQGGISDNGGGFSVTFNMNSGFRLGGNNTYTGGTIIQNNSLFTTTSSLPVAGGVNIQVGGNFLIFEQGFPGTYAGAISGPGNLLLSGSNITLTNTGNNWSGETDIDSNSILIGTTQTISSSTSSINFLELTPGGVFNLNQNFAGTFSPPIIGVGAVLISGGGVVTLSNVGNTYNQGTTVTSGTVQVGADSNLGAAGTKVILGQAPTDTPAFQANASFTTARPFTLNANTSIIDPNGNTLTYTGTVSGPTPPAGTQALQVGISTGGILLLQGAFNNNGGITVTSGTLAVAGAGTLPTVGTSPQGDIILNSPASPALDVASATQLTVGNISGSGNISLGVNILTATISQGTPSFPLSYSGVISGVGGQIIMTGAGVWGWSNNSTYTGATTINNGTLAMTGTGVFPATSPLTINNPGAFDISAATSAQTVLNVSGSGAINLGTKTLTVNTTLNTTFSGNIAPTAGSIISNGPSTWSWSGTNNYTGSTTINNGTLAIIGGGNFPPNSALTINAPGIFDISNATAQQTATNITGNGNINLGGITLQALITSPTAYSGVISGAGGQIIKNGTSTWTWNQAQAYTGRTTITDGQLFLTGAGAVIGDLDVLSSVNPAFDISSAGNQSIGNLFGTGNINLGANTLTVNITIPSPYAGQLLGTGGLVKNGPQTLDLAGANSYSGGTTINVGTLAIEGGGQIGPGSMTINAPGIFDISPAVSAQTIGTLSGGGAVVLGNNTLTHVPTGNTIFSGTITGNPSSVFEEKAVPSLTLSSVSLNMTGELRVSQGTVLAGATNILPNLRLLHISSGATFNLNGFDQSMGDLDSGGTLNLGGNTFTNNSQSDRIFSGVIQGNGSSKFIHNGAFTLTLQGVSTTSGAFEVAGGIVKVDSGASLLNATTTVDAGGRLKGTGSVGTLNNFGVVQPGSSIGTLHVVGPYTESGTLEIEVNDKGQSSLLDVTGAITINPGTTLHIKPKHGTYNSSLVYTVETNTGARTGTYTTLKTSLANRFNVTAIYNPNDIQIALGVTPFPIIINGGNAGAVAACFETIPGGNGTDHEVVVNALEDLSDDLVALRKAFNQLQPSQLNALPLAQQNNDILVRSALSQRFSYRRTLDLPYPRPAPVTDATTESTESTPAPQMSTTMPTVRKGAIWIDGLGKYAHQNNKQDNPGYKAATGGALIGADYRFFSRAYFGAALGYTSTNLRINEAAGHAHIHSGYGALYGTLFSKRAFFDASAIASYNHYHVNRHIHFTGINRHARNSHNGYQLGGSLGMGFFINTHNLQIQPYDRADFIFTHQNKFREHGAQSINLRVKHKDSRYVRNDLGVKVLRCWEFAKASFIPYIKASWIWEQQLDKGHLSSSFTESSCQFIVIGMHPIRSLFAPSIGFTTLAYKDAFSFSFHYDAEIGSKFWENRAYLNFTYRY